MMRDLDGRKTYALGGILVAYLVIQAVVGADPDTNIVYGLLAGMGVTLRHGIAKASR